MAQIATFELPLRGRNWYTGGGEFDHRDFRIRGGLFAAAVLQLAVEEHGAGKQLLRWRVWPRVSTGLLIASAILAVLAFRAAKDHARVAAAGCRAAASFRCCYGVIGIDVGITLLSAETLRTSNVWKCSMANPEAPGHLRWLASNGRERASRV
jgi:hypothetical protein